MDGCVRVRNEVARMSTDAGTGKNTLAVTTTTVGDGAVHMGWAARSKRFVHVLTLGSDVSCCSDACVWVVRAARGIRFRCLVLLGG